MTKPVYKRLSFIDSGQLNFALCNIRSPSSKTFIINYLIVDHRLDFTSQTETWLDSDIVIPLTFAR